MTGSSVDASPLKDSPPPLLQVDSLTVGFTRDGDPDAVAFAVEDVSFSLSRGRTLCLVGESGCGKSVTALSIPRLLPSPPSRLVRGSVFFDGRDLACMPETDLARIRGSRIGMVFQDPMTSLNPVMRVGEQMTEGLRLHRGLDAKTARGAAISLLERVGIALPGERVDDFPHQMSGGMRQRVMIGMALACEPDLLIADEPTTALDVTVQRQILALIRDLVRGSGSSLLLITHDLGVVAQTPDNMAVMYAGRIVEYGPVADILAGPKHPYTMGLLHSRPGGRANAGAGNSSGKAGLRRHLQAIPGAVPDLWARPQGCAFHPRCAYAFERCARELPPFFTIEAGSGGLREPDEPLHETPLWQSRCWLNAG